MTEENKQALIQKLKDAGVKKAYVYFDGCGDSGSIEEIDLKPLTKDTPGYEEIRKEVERFTYEWLDHTGIDWYNNDGGYGYLNIDVETKEVSLEVNTRYTEINQEVF